MEVFQGAVYPGCWLVSVSTFKGVFHVIVFIYFTSKSALFGTNNYYQGNASEFTANVYWLNNFDNIYQSYGKMKCIFIVFYYIE